MFYCPFAEMFYLLLFASICCWFYRESISLLDIFSHFFQGANTQMEVLSKESQSIEIPKEGVMGVSPNRHSRCWLVFRRKRRDTRHFREPRVCFENEAGGWPLQPIECFGWFFLAGVSRIQCRVGKVAQSSLPGFAQKSVALLLDGAR